ncbi:MAG TPA: rRNA maturation RNase YbeY [Rhabdochlamydiaceae bacterium]|nr:rRNA maturation RNase YbeY [Rhabdochlamydiaceae bacterium]
MTLKIYNRQSNLRIDCSSVKKLVMFFLQQKRISNQDVAIYFVGIRKISQLHAKYFNDPTPTDCITFPLNDQLLGEIFVCPKAALDYNPKKPYEETTLYIIHGLLHLLGYDDIDNKKKARMRREEKRLIALAKKHRYMIKEGP